MAKIRGKFAIPFLNPHFLIILLVKVDRKFFLPKKDRRDKALFTKFFCRLFGNFNNPFLFLGYNYYGIKMREIKISEKPKVKPPIHLACLGLLSLSLIPPDPGEKILKLTEMWKQNGLGLEGLGAMSIGMIFMLFLLYSGLYLLSREYNKNQRP